MLQGHLKIADYIARNVNEKNPSTNTGWTPLHFLAQFGCNDTFRYIHDYCEDKNPVTGDSGETVLHKAAEAEGYSLKCKDFLIEGVFFFELLWCCGGSRTSTKAQRKRSPLLKSLLSTMSNKILFKF